MTSKCSQAFFPFTSLQRLSIFLSNKDTDNKLEDMTRIVGSNGEAFPTIRIQWSDFCVGQRPRIVAQYDENLSKEHAQNIVPISVQTSHSQAATKKLTYQLKRMAVSFRDELILHLDARDRKVDIEVEPYLTTMRDVSSPNGEGALVNIHGAKFSVKSNVVDGGDIEVWTDQGISKIADSVGSAFQQFGIDWTTPSRLLRSGSFPDFPRLLFKEGTKAANLFNLFGFTELKFMTSSGPGCIPLHHQSDMGEDKVLRGFASSALSPRMNTYATIKADLICDTNFLSVVPGVFFDAAVFKCDASDGSISREMCQNSPHVFQKEVTLGLSARVLGLVLEFGWPAKNILTSSPRIYFSVDRSSKTLPGVKPS